MQPPSNRSFGFTFVAVFFILALYPVFGGGALQVWAAVVAAIILGITLVAPSALSPLNRLWHRLGMALHRIVSPVVLGVLYFVIITPIGLMQRMFGKDPMARKWDKAADTYWIRRAPDEAPGRRMPDQF